MRTLCFLIMAFLLQSGWSTSNVHYHNEGGYSLENAFRTGVDTDNKPLFLCLAKLFGSLQPGKTWAGYGHCNVPYGGKEYVVDQFEIPSRETFRRIFWSVDGGAAISVGRDTNGNPLFLCQADFNGSKQPGKTWPGYNHCNISYGGQEIITDNYRVLAKYDQYAQNGQRHGYQQQYNKHYHDNPQGNQQCLQGPFGKSACGYNCIQSINNVGCAALPDQQCVSDNFGRIACGYGCVKTPTKVACSSQRGENCISNQFNEIRCGRNCQLDNFNRIQCN